MKIKHSILLVMASFTLLFGACKKTEYTFGKIIAPGAITITTTIQGATTATPAGDGTGKVSILVATNNALTYKIYFGNGDSVLTSSGKVNYTYTTLDTNQYTITVNAIGTGGATSTQSKQIKVLYTYAIPAAIMSMLTNGSSKKWVVAKDTAGNFGVGPLATFTPDYYKAGPNQEPACSYAGVITFAQASPISITMDNNNMGFSFLIAVATSYYGKSGGDACYPMVTTGAKPLGFSGANSGSTPSNSTGVQFTVPGYGLVNYGTGGNTYEILSLSATVMVLRNVGIDGNAWYQMLRAQ